MSTAKAFVDELYKRFDKDDVNANILYVGGRTGMSGDKGGKSVEQRVIGDATDIPFVTISSGKLQRRLDGTLLKMPFGVTAGFFQSLRILREFKPDVVFSTGGFVTVPVAMAAWVLRIPIYLHEQTAAIGLANKIVSRFAKKIFITFESSKSEFPEGKVVHTGHLLRKAIFQKESDTPLARELKAALNGNNMRVVTLIGGGQGSHKLNMAFKDALPKLLEKYILVLQLGNNSQFDDFATLNEIKQSLPDKLRSRLILTKFITEDEIGFILDKTDIFVGRAGAALVYEMAVLRKPSIFVPIPWVTHNEQEKNAQNLVDAGLARILPEANLSGDALSAEIEQLASDLDSGRVKINDELLTNRFPTNGPAVVVDEVTVFLSECT